MRFFGSGLLVGLIYDVDFIISRLYEAVVV